MGVWFQWITNWFYPGMWCYLPVVKGQWGVRAGADIHQPATSPHHSAMPTLVDFDVFITI